MKRSGKCMAICSSHSQHNLFRVFAFPFINKNNLYECIVARSLLSFVFPEGEARRYCSFRTTTRAFSTSSSLFSSSTPPPSPPTPTSVLFPSPGTISKLHSEEKKLSRGCGSPSSSTPSSSLFFSQPQLQDSSDATPPLEKEKKKERNKMKWEEEEEEHDDHSYSHLFGEKGMHRTTTTTEEEETEAAAALSLHRSRVSKTHRFLRLVLDTKEEQLWKDLLSSAIRSYGTLQTKHLEEWLRMVVRPPPHSPPSSSLSSSSTHISEKGGEEEEEPLPPPKYPYERLQRMVEVVQYIHEVQEEVILERHHHRQEEVVEEGKVSPVRPPPPPHSEDRRARGVRSVVVVEEVSARGEKRARGGEEEEIVEREREENLPFLCTPRVMVQLLVQMIRGAENTMHRLRCTLDPRLVVGEMRKREGKRGEEEEDTRNFLSSSSSSFLSSCTSDTLLEKGKEIQGDHPLGTRSSTSTSRNAEDNNDLVGQQHVGEGVVLVDVQFSSSSSLPPPSLLPPSKLYFSYAALWRFLSWMERHQLHIHSDKLIDLLEAGVDSDVEEERLRALLTAPAAGSGGSGKSNLNLAFLSSTLFPASSGSSNHHNNSNNNNVSFMSHQALHCRREARIAYLRSERVWAGVSTVSSTTAATTTSHGTMRNPPASKRGRSSLLSSSSFQKPSSSPGIRHETKKS